MPLSVSRLRRWLGMALILVCAMVAITYFYARRGVQNALKQVPDKLGIDIQQSAQQFTISKSEQGRTLFKVQASKAVQFKEGGRAELHDVTITIYGRDASRFDQVYGKTFDYNQQTGDITSQGEASIDLQANPQGATDLDQATPKELKNPIHLKTRNLVFNQKTGDGWTAEPLQFSVPEADGSAVGAKYTAKDGLLTLQSRVRILLHAPRPWTILAEKARLEKNPREIVLFHAQAESAQQKAQADEATLYLRPDNTLEHAIGDGNVHIRSLAGGRSPASQPSGGVAAPRSSEVSANRLELKMLPRNVVANAVLTGNVQLKNQEPLGGGSAGRAELSFGANNALTKVHAEQQVKLRQEHEPSASTAQDVEVTAPAMDFFVAKGQHLTRAETLGSPQISLLPTDSKQGITRITADKFIAKFDSLGELSQVHGEANARVVTTALPGSSPPQPDRVSTSDSIDAYFRPGTGVESLLQSGRFSYASGTQKAFADRARYTSANQFLVLNGSPRIIDAGSATTARVVRLNRASGQGFAEGDVRTTYSDLKSQANGAMLASSDPVHVTAENMTARNNPSVAVYTGNARLWQNANVLEAPSIEFQKESRMVIANSSPNQKVSTVWLGSDTGGKVTPVEVRANHLVYRDSERQAHYEGGVTVTSSDLTVTSNQMDVFLAPAGGSSSPPAVGPAKLEKIVASGSVVLTEPNRRGTGNQLVYTASDDKFVLTGGPPSIFDAERGKITGVSLTLYRQSDRVVVEGDSSSRAVTQTRVVR
jgi:lipopolysaccharide export system protein LptA